MSRCGSLGTNVIFFFTISEALTLSEAVSLVENWSDDDELDLILLPPNNDTVSDEEQIDDNVLESQDVGDVVGEIEVSTRGRPNSFCFIF